MGRPSFVDRVEVLVRAGAGGNGCISFRREKFVPRGGPNGGDGGAGGAVRFLVDPNVDTLVALKFKPQQEAERGEHGQGKSRHGRSGVDLVVRVPAGTEVRDRDSGELLFDLVVPGQEVVVARGGRGGRGNARFATAAVQAPRHAEPGAPGEERRLRVLLKTVADAGLVGLPNAGKSTLLGAISEAHPKVAPYPFTTLHPGIGTVCFPDLVSYTVADIPGLVAGAHRNVGLGHEFLRHIERTRLLIYVLDMAGVDGRDPGADLITLHEEIALHSLALAGKPSLVVGNKMDMPAAHVNRERLRDVLPKETIWIAAQTGFGLDEFRRRFREALDRLKAPEPGATAGAAAPRGEGGEQ